MNRYFDEILKRLTKIADIPIEEDSGIRMVRLYEAEGIIKDVMRKYNDEKWHHLYKDDFPIDYYGTREITVMISYRRKKAPPGKAYDVARYVFKENKFYTQEGTDITEMVEAWTPCPFI